MYVAGTFVVDITRTSGNFENASTASTNMVHCKGPVKSNWAHCQGLNAHTQGCSGATGSTRFNNWQAEHYFAKFLIVVLTRPLMSFVHHLGDPDVAPAAGLLTISGE